MTQAFGLSVTIASRVRVQARLVEIARILDAIGHQGAFITDRTLIADFRLDLVDRRIAREKLGFDIKDGDALVDLADRLTR